MTARCFILMSLIAASGCVSKSATRTIVTPKPKSDSAAPVATTQPILYHRTGGIAGTDDRLVIWPDGFVQTEGKLFRDAALKLPGERVHQLELLFAQWSSLKGEYLTNNIADAYTITIHYGDKAVTASDIAPELPQSFRDVFTALEAVAFEAQRQQDEAKPPAEPATP
jgi:hypothetical protein